MDESCNKIRLLRLWEILKKETDEDHPMGTTTLINRLNDEGMKCNRATLYGDIALLNKFGYEILCNRAISNEYYVVNRDFDIPEIQILIDAVQAASFVTEHKTPVLVDKLAQLAGSQRAVVLKKNIVEFSTVKGDNELIYYMVDEITTAITKKKKIEFYYFDLANRGTRQGGPRRWRNRCEIHRQKQYRNRRRRRTRAFDARALRTHKQSGHLFGAPCLLGVHQRLSCLPHKDGFIAVLFMRRIRYIR